MKFCGIKACTATSYVLIWALLVVNVPEGIVLCFGSDGHVHVETADHARCRHSDQTDDSHEAYEKQLVLCKN